MPFSPLLQGNPLSHVGITLELPGVWCVQIIKFTEQGRVDATSQRVTFVQNLDTEIAGVSVTEYSEIIASSQVTRRAVASCVATGQ